MPIDATRIDKEVDELEQRLKEAREWRNKCVNSANKYYELIKPVLRKRGIKVKKTQIFFNLSVGRERYNHAIAQIEFETPYASTHDSIKFKHFEKEIKTLGIPMPHGPTIHDITITLYEGTLFGQYRR